MALDSGTKSNAKALKKKWSREEIFAPIDLYEARPCLWEISFKEYHNREVTAKKHKR